MSVSFAAGSRAAFQSDEQSVQPASIADLLLRAAQQHPHAGIHFVAAEIDTLLTYPALLREARSMSAGLRAHGCIPGSRVALLLERARDVIPAFWGCVLGGYLPCPLTPARNDASQRARQVRHVARLLDGPLLVTTRASKDEFPDLHAVDLDTLRTETPVDGSHEARPGDPAILMLTSGSTGNSKAVVLTHGNLLASMSGKAQRQQVSADDITLNWISFDHVAALLEVHLISVYAGALQIQVEPAAILADPLLFLRLIDRYRVSLTFSPNFLLGQINAALRSPGTADKPFALDLSCVRYIISGGEANVVETGQCFLKLLAPCGLPHTAVRPAFGMTETCAGSIYSGEFPDCDAAHEFASVGQPIAGLHMRIADEHGASAASAEAGELQLRGAMIFDRYYNDEVATRGAFTADGWFRTGDLGRIEQGRLALVGRSKDSIIVNGVNYFSQELEVALEALDGIERSFVAVFPTRPKDADTEQLVVTFATRIALTDEAGLHQLAVAIRNTTILLWGFRPALIIPLPKEAFPKTSLGKIQRSLLRRQVESGDLAAHAQFMADVTRRQLGASEPLDGPVEAAVADLYARVLGLEPQSLGANAGFFDLGGTSLDIFKLKHSVETHFALADLPVVTLLQNPTVRALAARVAAANREDCSHYDPLVPLQVTGNKTPLFCIHPGTGEVLVFVSLASYFSNDRPFYALRARGFKQGEAYFASFDEIATTYVEAIRKRQPQGPYALAGYSFGAAVAFEVARQLEALGERVSFLGCIDGTPYIGDPEGRLDFVGSTVIVAFFLGLLDKQQMLQLPQQIRTANHEACAYILQLAPAQRIAELGLDSSKFKAWAALAYSLVVLGEAYSPAGNVESATVFYADPLRGTKQQWLNTQLRNWDRFTRMPNRYVEVPGEHNSLLGPKHVAAFQTVLRAEIDRALGGR
jgi:acyl-CoA synthetase (AMP-forming)/AMP-acid ligase II/thioesterase domain-containing protein